MVMHVCFKTYTFLKVFWIRGSAAEAGRRRNPGVGIQTMSFRAVSHHAVAMQLFQKSV
mgnify:CR=1 FL=1